MNQENKPRYSTVGQIILAIGGFAGMGLGAMVMIALGQSGAIPGAAFVGGGCLIGMAIAYPFTRQFPGKL